MLVKLPGYQMMLKPVTFRNSISMLTDMSWISTFNKSFDFPGNPRNYKTDGFGNSGLIRLNNCAGLVMTMTSEWVTVLPKAELHMHIDGSLQAERLLQLAKKNGIDLPYGTVEEVDNAYQFKDLQSFLDLYYLGASVLREEDDFYHLMMDYLLKCRENHIVHAEIMVEPQTYLVNGIAFDTFMPGFKRAIAEAQSQWGISALLILSLLKHTTEDECIDVLKMADNYPGDFVALGMASTEIGNPPEKFQRLYQLGRERGYYLQTHSGEEGSADIIWSSLQVMQVERIDHGVRCTDDPLLVDYLSTRKIPLTVCPLSNVRLRVFDKIEDHNIIELLKKGVLVTVNSDDPAYFGGFLNANYHALIDAFDLDKEDVLVLVKNGFRASYLPEDRVQTFIDELDQMVGG